VSELSFDVVSHAELASVSGVLDAGSHVLLGSERDGTSTVVQLAAGLVKPNAGRISLAGQAPFSSASTRRSIGSLCAKEQLPSARHAAGALELALQARGEARSALSVLDAAGLTHLAARRLSDLSARETRALALALALSHPKPTLLALHEPLALVGIVQERFLLDALAQCRARGAVVLSTANRSEDAARLGGELHALERGIWLDSAANRTPPHRVALRVQTPDSEQLAACLADAMEISSIIRVGSSELLIHGLDLERLAGSVVAQARAASVHISAMREDTAALEPLAAARSGIAQAFEDARAE
jgi:ABC-type multidrug transport system ATPase subunit